MNKKIPPAQPMPMRPSAPRTKIIPAGRITPSPNPSQPFKSQIRSIQNTIPEFKMGSEGPAPSTLQNVAMGNRPGDASSYNGRFGTQMKPKPVLVKPKPVQNADQKMAVMDSLKRAFTKGKSKPRAMGGMQ